MPLPKSLTSIYGKSPVLPSLWKRYTKEQIIDSIERNYGIITLICADLDCTPSQLYKALSKWNIREKLAEAKQNLVGLAESAILECLVSQNESIKLKAAETTLKSLGKEEWSSQPQIQINQEVKSDADKAIEIKNIFGLQ